MPDEVTTALDALVARGPLGVVFQPIVDLRRAELFGYEVLGRCGPVEGPLAEAARSPASLLDLAGQHGRLLALDRRWRELALATIAERPPSSELFFVNVDPRVVDDPMYTQGHTLALVKQYRLSPERFVLELTEAPSRDPAAVERILAQYGRQGFRVALDDLGAGQQSLVTLLRLSPDIVKLDRDLVRAVDADPAKGHLLRALAEFARRTGIQLVAEGIETEGELRAVVEAGVPLGQGFLLGRPAPLPPPLSTNARALLRQEQRATRRFEVRFRSQRDPGMLLAELVEGLRAASALEAMLPLVTDCAASLLDVERVSLRLLDESRTRLLVAARTGGALHAGGGPDFIVGEGLAGWVAKTGLPLRLDHATDDPRFVSKPGMHGPMGAFLGVPLLDARGPIGVLAATSPEAGAFSLVDERWLRVVAGAAAPYIGMARLSHLTVTDPLTMALNRRGLEQLFRDRDVASAEPFSVIAIDLDRFKMWNDRLGHAAGDEALRSVVQTIMSTLRRSDRVVRLGGDELLVILPGIGLDSAVVVAQRLRESISATEILPGLTLTISAGVAEAALGEDRDALLRRADQALYRAKSGGKNRVESAPVALP
jgi:diguanylate cyclase (GGDEF)-like protein